MVCDILNKWKCKECPLKDDDAIKVVKCENLNQEDLDCSMPIQVEQIRKHK